MKLVLAIVLLAIAVLAAPLIFSPGGPGGTAAIDSAPWQVAVREGGTSRVFGLDIGQSTLGDARQALGPDVDIAIVAAPGEAGSLEAYYSSFSAGGVTGKLILTAALDQASLAGMLSRAVKTEYMESTTRKSTLDPDDLARAMATPIRSIAFIPSINLDEQTMVSRFGEPQARLRSAEGMQHLLYPEKGLDIIIDAQGKELLQYVAPADFDALRAPLDRFSDQAAGPGK